MEYGIREHAVYYALLAKAVLEQTGSEDLLKEITCHYGKRRGARMHANAEAAGYGSDLSAFFKAGEWAGKPGENISELTCLKEQTESRVSVCAWYDAWKQYGLLDYGCYYCRWIDVSMAEGFEGSFTLAVPSAKGYGDADCRFVWDQGLEETPSEKPFLRPFSMHIQELHDAADAVLHSKLPQKAERILDQAEDEFCRMLEKPLP